MPRNDIAIQVRGLSKTYAVTRSGEGHSTLAEAVIARVRRPFRRRPVEAFKALDGVSFDVRRGDVVGIMGRNGAGKSTLLKVLSRITEPTAGEVRLWGRVGSLLEVGTGFHPELTGRENVYLNGTILGMRRGEIDRAFDAIADFAGVERFLDMPVKRYSSGMYVRLAFAVAAHLPSEILIVDEVLAVGDAEFQRKCLGKMRDIAGNGRTVLFVSHHVQSVRVLCNRAVLMQAGRCAFVGDVAGAVDRYVAGFARPEEAGEDPARRPGTGEYRFVDASPVHPYFACGEVKRVRFRAERRRPFTAPMFVSCHVVNESGVTILQCDSRLVDGWLHPDDQIERELVIRTPWFKPGRYRVDLFLCSSGVIDHYEAACTIDVAALMPYPTTGNDETTANGVVFADFEYARQTESSRADDGPRGATCLLKS